MPGSAKPEATYLLDTSAILAYLLNEPEAGRIDALHRQAVLPFIALAELYAALWIRHGQAKADEVVATVRQWQCSWLWPTEEVVLLSGRLRAVYRLGLGDSFIAALAMSHGITLVTKDRDFSALRPSLQLLFLNPNTSQDLPDRSRPNASTLRAQTIESRRAR